MIKRTLNRMELKSSMNLLLTLNIILLEEVERLLDNNHQIEERKNLPNQSKNEDFKNPQIKFCPFCGSEFVKNAKFCHVCGNSLNINKKKRKKDVNWIEIKKGGQEVTVTIKSKNNLFKINPFESDNIYSIKNGYEFDNKPIIDKFHNRIKELQEKYNFNIYR